MITLENALISLKPNAEWTLEDSSNVNTLIWVDSKQTKPTTAEINAEVIRLQAIEDYQAPRRAEYPSIADQLDDIYHNGIDAWKATIKTTKDKYPKPEDT